jgi:tRNA-2-methylthio-N6-dimethylallyladenosine synthase
MRFHVSTFGCQMNVGDSDWLTRALAARGWQEASEETAEVFILNTCSVRDKPEQKVYSLLGRLSPLAEHRDGFIAVGGCVAQQVGHELIRRFPRVRLVFGTDQVSMVPAQLERLASLGGPRAPALCLTEFMEHYAERGHPDSDTPAPVSAFVNIMQGCDNFCTYCIVPYVRGRQKSRSAEAVVEECRAWLAQGTREIVLLGQNVNSFGQDAGGDGTTFAHLLARVAALPGCARLRFTTSHPKDISEEVIRAFGELDTLCPSLHLPLQSGSDDILARMGRKYDSARYLEIVDALRAARPDIALTTDLMVGFPGETEAQFRRTLEMIRRVGFANSFSFKYSDRPGTRASRLEDKVPEPVKIERLARLQDLQRRMTEAGYRDMVGSVTCVLFERESHRSAEGRRQWRGRDPVGRVVNVDVGRNTDLTGRLARVTIKIPKKHSLWGTMAGETW